MTKKRPQTRSLLNVEKRKHEYQTRLVQTVTVTLEGDNRRGKNSNKASAKAI